MKGKRTPHQSSTLHPSVGESHDDWSHRAGHGHSNAFLSERLAAQQTSPREEAGLSTGAGSLFGQAIAPAPLHGHDHGHGHNHGPAQEGPRPNRSGQQTTSDGAASRRPGAPLTAAEREALFQSLNAVPRTAQILEEIRSVKGGLDFPLKWSGRGTYMMSGEIWLDLRGDATELTVTMAHELVHLLSFFKGFNPNPRELSKDEYVDAMIGDELDSEKASIVTGLQLTDGNGEPRSRDFKKWLQANHPGLLERATRSRESTDWAKVEELARIWSDDQFKNVFKTSNTGENYYDYYGSHWRRSQPGPAAPDAPAQMPAPGDMAREGTLTETRDRSKAVPLAQALTEARAQGAPSAATS
ncbi:MAG TPA: hypothetical protein DFR83_04435 [Deltaproteobacteria bacterium]|nr:hypothetical protein [Deltaproteobacteria bacterium]